MYYYTNNHSNCLMDISESCLVLLFNIKNTFNPQFVECYNRMRDSSAILSHDYTLEHQNKQMMKSWRRWRKRCIDNNVHQKTEQLDWSFITLFTTVHHSDWRPDIENRVYMRHPRKRSVIHDQTAGLDQESFDDDYAATPLGLTTVCFSMQQNFDLDVSHQINKSTK